MRLRQVSSFALALVIAASVPRVALAALTDSEKAVVREFVQKASLDSAGRVRALVARPDLSADEVAEPLTAAFAESPFDDKHRRFTEALLLGPGSGASRNTLAPAIVQALLARAAARMSEIPLEASANVDQRARDAADEIVAVHAFIDARIANAGNPSAEGHDPSAGIRDDADKACTLLYKTHLTAHERWFKVKGRASRELIRVRTQVELTVIDLGRGVVARQELGEWLGLAGARRAVFERRGVLVEADDLGQEGPIASSVRMLESTPHATDGLSAWLLSKVSPLGLSGRGRVDRAGVVLGDTLHPLVGDVLWPAEVKPSSPDESAAAVAWSVAEMATARALAVDPALAQSARRAAEHAGRAGAPGFLATDVTKLPLVGDAGAAATPALVIGGAVRLLLVDGPRAIDLALIRAAGGHPEVLEQLAVALTVVAGGNASATLGHTRDDGAVEPVSLTDVKSEQGVVTAFVLGGKHYALTPDSDGAYTATVNGATPKLTALSTFHERTAPGDNWTAAGATYDKLFGEPRAVGLDDGRLVLEGGKGGFDAVATGAETSDVEVSAVILPAGTGGGLLARATVGDTSYSGIGLMLDAAQARLVLFDGHGKGIELAGAVPLPEAPVEGYPVSLTVAGDKVTAKVGAVTLAGKLLHEVPPGRVGLAARSEGRLDVRHLKVTVKAAK